MFKLPLRKLYFIVKICFLLVIVLMTLSLFEYWRGGWRGTRAVILDPEEDKYERQILEDEARIIPGLGEGGAPAYLADEEKRLGEESEKKYAINTYLSDRIAYNRTLKDFRNPACERVTYDAELPSASVIIIFHNEPYSVVVRTIWSVLNTARRDRPWHRRANFLESGTGRIMKLGYPGQPQDSEHVYLREIILVDDNSTLPELRGKLARYVRTRTPPGLVRVLRLPDRIGLTRARLAGARFAAGEVLVFLDAHCEGVTDWLRPLLQRVKDEPTAVVMPVIDVIEHKDFYYSVQQPSVFQGLMRARVRGARAARGDVLVFLDAHCEGGADWLRPLLQRLKHKRDAVVTPVIDVVDQNSFHLDGEDPIQVGGFTFVGHFTWIDVPEREKRRRGSDIAPTWSPTMAGGLFAIRRAYYWELGAYDEQMAGWGGENLEMSFRIWQCGGTLETIPCSRVGHVFRAFHPYGLPASTDTHGINTARMAEVWMDEYKELFYLHRPDLRKNPKIGDVTHRKVLREKLHCKSFQWFLDNVYQEKYVPVRDSRAYGRVQNPATHLCLDSMQRDGDAAPLGYYPCHDRLTPTQYFSLSLHGELRDEEKCAEVQFIRRRGAELEDGVSRLVVMVTCRDNAIRMQWRYVEATGQLQHVDSGLCLDVGGARAGDDARARDCDLRPSQRWTIDYLDGADNNTTKTGLLPEDLEQRLRQLKKQRRRSRSLLSAEAEAEQAEAEEGRSGEMDLRGVRGGAGGEGEGWRRRKPRSKKRKKVVYKNKFIVRIERQKGNHSEEHLEMDIHCQHRRLYPNNSFVRDLVTILNDRDIRVINNGRVFEKNKVTDLGKRVLEKLPVEPTSEPSSAGILREQSSPSPAGASEPSTAPPDLWPPSPSLPPPPDQHLGDVAPDQHFGDVAPAQDFKDFAPPQHFEEIAPPQQFEDVAPPQHFEDVAPPKHFGDVAPAQHFEDVTPAHTTVPKRPKKHYHRHHRKKTQRRHKDARPHPQPALRAPPDPRYHVSIGIGRVNGSGARLRQSAERREPAYPGARDFQDMQLNAAEDEVRRTGARVEPEYSPREWYSQPEHSEGHSQQQREDDVKYEFQEVKHTRPPPPDSRAGHFRAQILHVNDFEGDGETSDKESRRSRPRERHGGQPPQRQGAQHPGRQGAQHPGRQGAQHPGRQGAQHPSPPPPPDQLPPWSPPRHPGYSNKHPGEPRDKPTPWEVGTAFRTSRPRGGGGGGGGAAPQFPAGEGEGEGEREGGAAPAPLQPAQDYERPPAEQPEEDEMRAHEDGDDVSSDDALQVLVRSNMTFNLGDHLMPARRSADGGLVIPSDSDTSDSASDDSDVLSV